MPGGAAATLAVVLFLTLASSLAFAADAAPPAAPHVPTAIDDGTQQSVDLVTSLIKMVAALGGICALAVITVRVLGPRLSPMAGRPDDLIRVLDVKRLDPKTALYVVEIGGRHALIAVSEHEVQSLSRLELDDEIIRGKLASRDDAAKPAHIFARVLAGAGRKETFRPLARGGAGKTGANVEEPS